MAKSKKKKDKKVAEEYHKTKGKVFKTPQSKWRFDMTGGRMM
jgi:hypothetical protein